MDIQDSKLIRRGGDIRIPGREKVVIIDSNSKIVQLLKLILPVGGVKYVVPSGRLVSSQWLEGSLLEVQIAETGEKITIYPKFNILGLFSGENAGETLAATLHNHLDVQLACIRQRLHSILRDYVGLRCPEEKLSGIANGESKNAEALKEIIGQQLGLEIDWSLELEPEIMRWIHQLQAQLTQAVTKSFNEESRTAQFNLTFTSRIVGVDPAKHYIVQRRARSGSPPDQEMKLVLRHVQDILNPAFGIFGDGLRIWQYPNFWALVHQAFSAVVVPRIVKEFGYKMEFDDFKRERTAAERQTLALLEDQKRLEEEFLEAEQFYKEVREQERKILREADYNLQNRNVIAIGPVIERAAKSVRDAQAKMESASQGSASQLGPEDNVRAKIALKRFHDQLGLNCPGLLLMDDTQPPEKPKSANEPGN